MAEDDDRSWRRLTANFAFVSSVAVSLTCVAIGESAMQLSALSAPTSALAARAPAFGAIDRTATGSIKRPKPGSSPDDRANTNQGRDVN